MAVFKSLLLGLIFSGLNELRERVGSIVAPARCMVCLGEGSWLCAACAMGLPPWRPLCITCRTASLHGLTCRQCRENTPLTGVVSIGAYEGEWLRRAVHWLKFKGVRDIVPTLAHLLAAQLPLIAPLPSLRHHGVLMPIPLHSRRERQRGFNQSTLLAAAVAHITHIPLFTHLVRSRFTWTQTKLPLELRRQNLHNAFTLTRPLAASVRTVLIVDDVTTTGATLAAAAEVLQRPHHDRQIWGCTVARG